MWIAISVEFGPGSRLVAPSRSRNSSRVIQRRLRTTSSSIIAMCAAGPPNAVVPNRRKRRARSRSEARSLRPRDISRFCGSAIWLKCFCSQTLIDRPSTGTYNKQEDRAEQHRPVRARLVRKAPEAGVWDAAKAEASEAVSEQDGDLCRENRH